MGDKKNWFKRSLVLFLALMLVCNGMSQTMLTVFAEEETTVPEASVEEQAAESEGSGNADGTEVIMDMEDPVSDGAGKAQEENDQGEDAGRGAKWFTVEETISSADVDIPDNDELFAGYVDKLFFGDLNGGISLFRDFGSKVLSGDNLKVYTELKSWIGQVAAGTASSSGTSANYISTQKMLSDNNSNREFTFNLTADELAKSKNESDAEEFKKIVSEKFSSRIQTSIIVKYLLMDDPYDFYWYDKTTGMRCEYSYFVDEKNSTCTVSNIRMKFAVSTDFSPVAAGEAERLYLVDTGRISGAKEAAKKAKEIVQEYEGKSDYEKLAGYLNEICNLTSYNTDAAAKDKNTPYGNPWQLIWVFDGDESTMVVCEGYSKAFQYLCDLSTFESEDTICYTVTGQMSGGTGAGGHMWNIVTLEGSNYLVDVTNCDSGSIGAPDKLFLAGTSGSVAAGYTFRLSEDVLYTYDGDQEDLFGSGILTLANGKYTPIPGLNVAVDPIEVTYGADVKSTKLEGSASTEKDGTVVVVQGTFEWASGVTSFGNVGTNQINAVFTPDDLESYSPQTVTVRVTVDPKRITVTAEAKEKTYGSEDPELTYTIDSTTPLVGADKLSGKLTRVAGEDVKDGGYSITQGTLTEENNPNYQINFTDSLLTINPAEIPKVTVTAKQNILPGVGAFTEPVYLGLDNKEIPGTGTYSYGDKTNQSYKAMTDILKELEENDAGTINCTFQPSTGNYKVKTDVAIQFTVRDIEFIVGSEQASADNAVMIKENTVYGDVWSDIVKIKSIMAQAGNASDNNPEHFTLSVEGITDISSIPDAGTYTIKVLYNGTLNGKKYENSEVLSSTVTVQRKAIAVNPGNYKVSKVYDGTQSAGTATGALKVEGRLSTDTEEDLSVVVTPVEYTYPDAGKQTTMDVSFELIGNKVGNYAEPSSKTVTVSCEILPKPITPTVTVAGGSVYANGNALTPAVTVTDGTTELTLGKDYTITYSNNTDAGTGKVSVRPVANGNYQWTTAEADFTIGKAEYSGKKEDMKQTKYGNSDTYDLASLLPAGAKLGAAYILDADGIFAEGPVLNGTVLSYKLDSDTDKIGKTAEIQVPVTETTNYDPFTIAITVTLSDKLPQTDFKFDKAEINKVYGAGDFTVTAKNAASGSIVTYTSSDPAVAQVDADGKVHILKKGSAVITASASETDDYTGKSVTCKLTVSPKPLAWDTSALYARDKQGEVTDKAASLYGELRVSGILSSDTSKAVFSCPASKLTGTYADEKPGQKKVTLAWAGEQAVLEGEGADNYTMPSVLPEITGIINAVSEQENVPESTETVQYKLEVESGISQIPDELKKIDSLNAPAKIEEQMKSEVKQKLSSAGKVEVYDVVLMVNKENGGWVKADPDNFPEGGVTVTLPYPAGTGKDTHNFAVAHMFTIALNGHQPGEIEYPAVTKTDAGIRFKVTSLSPIAVGAEEIRPAASGSAAAGAGAANSASNKNAAAMTGDESNILLYVLLMMLGAAGMGFSVRRKTVR